MASWLLLLASCVVLVLLSHQAQACNPGEYMVDGGSCARCPSGHYCPRGISMFECSSGYYNPYTGATECTKCFTGEYAPYTGSQWCLHCPLGHKCSDPTQYPERCPSNTESNFWGTRCDPCPNGWKSPPGSSSCSPQLESTIG